MDALSVLPFSLYKTPILADARMSSYQSLTRTLQHSARSLTRHASERNPRQWRSSEEDRVPSI
ncbi:hypothetical protein M378DRAFT_161253 [Amanita muscaria Koide BX008]|uniref:Uncharacterized protein n=1 Tax=Amanita muscaria (strain Koide BX008) TaxID=946122 RepID=A0A0C2XB33_AMAMK|nr:hypothetical protein M378DRAFT_161253 [Amanita muscaria Koide BX008]